MLRKTHSIGFFFVIDLVMVIGTVRPSNMLEPEVDTEKKRKLK
jgi:hypothetical protein